MVLVQVIKKKTASYQRELHTESIKNFSQLCRHKIVLLPISIQLDRFFLFFQEMSFKTLGNQYRTVASFGHLKKTHFMSVTPVQKALDKQGWDTKAEDFSATIFRQPCRLKIISSNFYPARPIFLCPEMSFKTPLRRTNPGLREIPAAAITL